MVTEFKQLIGQAGLTTRSASDNIHLISLFRKALNFSLTHKIMFGEVIPRMINNWFEKAIQFDTNYREATAIFGPNKKTDNRTMNRSWYRPAEKKDLNVRGHPVSHDNRPHIETFQSAHPCSDDAIVTSHNRPYIETSRSAPFCHDNGVVTSHNRPHIETFRSAGPYIPPHHRPTFASWVRPCIKIFQSAGPHTPS